MAIKRIKGTQDILPGESLRWTVLENTVRRQMRLYNYSEIRTPVFEYTDLFARGIGQLTDIVSKEMYTFTDRSEKSITLKPEMTAPVMRAFIENNLQAQAPVNKLFYIASLFRQERPQAGRLRQFNQFGAEFIGSPAPQADAETILLAWDILAELGLSGLQLRINTIGDAACRIPYKKILQAFLKKEIQNPAPDVLERIEKNPLRVLDSKDPQLQPVIGHAPKLLDHLNTASHKHFDMVRDILGKQGIAYIEDTTLVRGLDYYTHTVYEITSNDLGAQNALLGGGRYDLLAEEIGGKAIPAVGFAAGMERILIALENQGRSPGGVEFPDIFIVALGVAATAEAQNWLRKLRQNGFSADSDFLGRSIKAQFREANRQQARFVLVLGEDELAKKVLSVKNMQTGEQKDVAFDSLIATLKSS